MSHTIQGFTQWQTARIVAAEDTLLTNYLASEFATLKAAGKIVGIHPATAVVLRAFAKDTNNDTATVVISGWMTDNKDKGTGPGHRLWRGQLLAGNHTASHIPLGDGKWGAAATWFEVDTWNEAGASGYNPAGATRLEVADQEAVILLPTLGYTHLAIEVTDILGGGTEITEIGFLWRPARVGEVMKTF